MGDFMYTMLHVTGRTKEMPPIDKNVPPSASRTQKLLLTEEDRRNNAMVVNQLRWYRENKFRMRNRRIFGRRPLRLQPTLPLPDIDNSGRAPWTLSMEHLQDLSNKLTVIYCTDSNHDDFTPMYEFIFKRWCPGNIHRLDIEFARSFAKLVAVPSEQAPATHDLVMVHRALFDAHAVARVQGFAKEDNWMWSADDSFIGDHQIEFYNIKPLLRALIVVIDKRVDEETPPNPKIEPDFENQRVRLVRTGINTGLTRPVTFDGLTVLEKINNDEVVTTLPEAIRFIMHLDQIEEAQTLRERRDDTILNHWLGLPNVLIDLYLQKADAPPHRCWTGAAADIPAGPSTRWWKDGLMDNQFEPLKISPTKQSENTEFLGENSNTSAVSPSTQAK